MKIRAQIAMVLNLDKCIGCHTCSVVCKNLWTSRKGLEYAWWNNVETKPGTGFPTNWEDQEKFQGGWILNDEGRLELRQGGKLKLLANIFDNPNMPSMDEDYYEPFTFDYEHLENAPVGQKTPPTARPRSMVTGERMEKIEKGSNWEDDLGGEFEKRGKDANFEGIQKKMHALFETTFMAYLPRLCEHCLNPSCVASCPSGSIYKREEDGIVLIDQNKCRGWRMCVSGCPYKKIFFNWDTKKSEKCVFCFPRIETGLPTLCSESCVGRIRYLGVILYDADRIEEVASARNEQDLYEEQLKIFLNPHDTEIARLAENAGIPESWIEAARKSPIYKMAIDWKIAFPLHPEWRTLPMVWYVPPLSPITAAAENGLIEKNGFFPDIESLRIPVKYLANLLTAGKEEPIVSALKRLIAMREYRREKTIMGTVNTEILSEAGLTVKQAEEMYRYLGIANYEDRFVIPTSHKEYALDAFSEKGACGFSSGNGCAKGEPSTMEEVPVHLNLRKKNMEV